MSHFVSFPEVKRSWFKAHKKSVRLHSGLQVDLRCVDQPKLRAPMTLFSAPKGSQYRNSGGFDTVRTENQRITVFSREHLLEETEEEDFRSVVSYGFLPNSGNRGEVEAGLAWASPQAG